MLDDEYAHPLSEDEREKLRQQFHNFSLPRITSPFTEQREGITRILDGFSAGYTRILIKLIVLVQMEQGALPLREGDTLDRYVNELFQSLHP